MAETVLAECSDEELLEEIGILVCVPCVGLIIIFYVNQGMYYQLKINKVTIMKFLICDLGQPNVVPEAGEN